MTAWCEYCGKSFRQRYDWQKLCPTCYGLRQDNGGADAWMQVMDLKRELAFMRMQLATSQQQATSVQAERCLLDHIRANPKPWLMLVHPDKHDGSQAATEATRLILELRKQGAGQRRGE